MEKVAFDGVTRFEDRYRLPLGVTVNLTDYSAQLATEVTFDLHVQLGTNYITHSPLCVAVTDLVPTHLLKTLPSGCVA